jgi:serine/threonine protein kinase/Tfp pilus assembly protein PilF
MQPDRDEYERLLQSVADCAPVDWAALDAAAATSAERTSYRNLRLVARVAELHRTLVLDEQDGPGWAPASDEGSMADPSTWGHLSITSRLASGAFGRIYRAHDSQLNRDVALKLLRGDIAMFRPVERLLAEARTLAQVRHPNVVTVHGADVRDGRAGLWMELVEGQTLDDWLSAHGPMGAGEATSLGIDLCRALAAVHSAGLVHGDVKAQNVMREKGGRIVLMDFGAGRAQGAEAAGVAGTPMYLAPEVLAGEPPTSQSDLYSVGVVLFHLLTGKYPCTGIDIESLRAAHADANRQWLRDLRPDLPPPLVQTIERAIDPDPARRFATAGEMEQALAGTLQLVPVAPARTTVRRLSPMLGFALGALVLLCVVVGLIVWSGRAANSVAVPAVRSIAVLPMKDLSNSTQSPYLADGLHDQLVTTIGQIDSLRVLSRTSVLKFKDSAEPSGEIAKTLGVDVALESTVSSTGTGSDGTPGRVRVNASLMLAGANTPLWSKTFEGNLGDLLKLEGEMARAIAAAVRVSITPDESTRLRHTPQTSPAAEEAYFQGRINLEGYGAAAARRALDSFERAVALDPGHAAAHVGAAFAYVSLAANGATTHQKARALALDHVRRALAIRDDLADAHAAMGDIEFLYEWNVKAADEEYRKALELNPNLSIARNQYAQLLAASKRFDGALSQATLGEAIEPGSTPSLMGLVLYYKRDYEAAENTTRAALNQRPNVTGLHILLGRIAEARGRLPESVDETRRALQLASPDGVPLRVQLIRLEALSDHKPDAQKMLRALQQETSQGQGQVQLTSRDVGYIRLAFGDREGSLQAFARAIEERDPSMVWLGVDPRVDSLRQDARFTAMLSQLGLP